MRLLKSREAAAAVDVKTWPTIIDTGEGEISPKLKEQQHLLPEVPKFLCQKCLCSSYVTTYALCQDRGKT